MSSFKNISIMLAVAVSLISTAGALNCYQCNSGVNPECENLREHLPHNVSVFYLPCEESKLLNPFCRTIVYKFKFLDSEDPRSNRVSRSCGYKAAPYECYNADNDHHLEKVCQCFTDGCNGAGNLPIFHIFSTFFIVIVARLLM